MYSNICQTFPYKEDNLQGWVKLHRQMTEWEWYKNIPVKVLFLHCLLRANHEDKKWQGVLIKKGSFITSYENLSIETGLSYKQVRTALDKLKMTGELAHQTTSQYSIITINNWDCFQNEGSQEGRRRADEGQTKGSQRATNKNDKNDKNEKEYTHTTSEEMQANDKLASIEFIHTKDYQFIKAVYQQVYGLKLARLSSEQLLVVRSWFEIVDNPTKIQLVLDYYKNEYTWDGGKKPSANWIFKSSTNFINVYDDMVQKRGSTFSMLKEG